MAHWKDQLRRATFRGFEFYTRSSESEHGRKVIHHDFFEREAPFNEDLGRRIKTFRLDAYLLGHDYLEQAKEFLELLQQEGPGELVHPYQGLHLVSAHSVTRRETQDEGGVARFSLVFKETGVAAAPTEKIDRAGSARTAADDLNAASASSLEENLITNGVSEFVREAASVEVSRFGSILAALDVAKGVSQQATELQVKASRLISDAAALVLVPADMVVAVREAVQTVQDAVGNAIGSLEAYRTLFGITPTNPRSSSTSAAQIAADDNAQASTELFSQIVVSEAVRSAVGVSWESRDQAIESRDAIIKEIDRLSDTAEDQIFFELQDLRSTVVQAIPPDGETLPEVGSFTPVTTLPALVIAYQLYDDAGRDSEIIARNDLRHPGFVAGGDPIEVLSNG